MAVVDGWVAWMVGGFFNKRGLLWGSKANQLLMLHFQWGLSSSVEAPNGPSSPLTSPSSPSSPTPRAWGPRAGGAVGSPGLSPVRSLTPYSPLFFPLGLSNEGAMSAPGCPPPPPACPYKQPSLGQMSIPDDSRWGFQMIWKITKICLKGCSILWPL